MLSRRFAWPALLALASGHVAAAPVLAQDETASEAAAPAAAATDAGAAREASEFPRTLVLPSGAFTLYEP